MVCFCVVVRLLELGYLCVFVAIDGKVVGVVDEGGVVAFSNLKNANWVFWWV